MVLFERIRIESGHHAAAAQVLDADANFAYLQAPTGPVTFGKTLDSTDDNIRAEPASVVAEGFDGAVGGDQQRQDVEAFRPFVINDFGRWNRGTAHQIERFRGIPSVTGNVWLAIFSKRAFEAKQLGIRARSENAPIRSNCHDLAVAGESQFANLNFLEAFPGHGLSRIAPKFFDVQGENLQ